MAASPGAALVAGLAPKRSLMRRKRRPCLQSMRPALRARVTAFGLRLGLGVEALEQAHRSGLGLLG